MDSWGDEYEELEWKYKSTVSDDEILILNQMIDLLFQKLKEHELEIQKLKNGKSN